MTRDQAQLIRLLLICAAWAIGRILTVGIPIELGDIVVPAALAVGVYVITEDLGRPRAGRGEGKYWRGRRIDDDRPGPRRLNQDLHPAPVETSRYTFTPMREEDFTLARRWLLEPHVRRWWHDDPKETDYPEGTIREWRLAVRGEDPTDMFVIEVDGRAIGTLQAYRVQDYPEYALEIGEVDEPAISLDLFIGEPELIGKGHGPTLIREFMRTAFERYGVSYCVIGPARANVAAIRAYEKAGFRYLRDYREPDTIDPEHVLLDLRRSDFG